MLTDGLIGKLNEAAAHFDRNPRHAALWALAAAASFVADLEAKEGRSDERPVELARPLMRLAQALAAMPEGHSDDFLRPAKGTRNKGVPVQTQMGRAEAAGTMNVLMMTGLSERQAAQTVARKISDSVLMRGTKGDSATKIMNWRKRIVGTAERRLVGDLPLAPAWEQQAAGIYNLAAEAGRMRLESGQSPEVVRKFILQRLRRAHPTAPAEQES